ncbi:MAG: hypothetical protein U0840_30740 [Gemmataceae bacterium]
MTGWTERFSHWSRPWVLLLTGLGLSLVGWLCAKLLPPYLTLGLLLTGFGFAISAVTRRLREETWAWPDRTESAAVVSLATMTAILGYDAMQRDWVSGHLFFGAVFFLGLAGSTLILLPSLLRRVALSLFVLFHFTGMAVCVTSVDPPNYTGLYVSKQLWTWIYRPYLSFMYMTNAYHFYAPDPGPPELFWFAVRYDDDSYAWVKLPHRENSPIGMHYQRMLALPAHTFGAMNRLPYSTAELALVTPAQRPRRGSWEEIYYRREMGSTLEYRRLEKPYLLPIPMVLDMDVSWQYREPNDTSKKTIASVARRIFWTAPLPRDAEGNVKPNVRPRSVKVYRVVHHVLTPAELAKGISPLEKTKHWPYFLGEFDASGNLVDEMDPFLYWFLPIAVVPAGYPNHGQSSRPGVPAIHARSVPPKDGFLLDCLEMHAAGRRRTAEEKK